MEKLDYLKTLGVDYLWLTPFFLSPQNDNGYDIQDYCQIDPLFGTMEDLDRLTTKAGELGMGLMFDMVFNHTSTSHEWFQKALNGDKKFQDYYSLRKGLRVIRRLTGSQSLAAVHGNIRRKWGNITFIYMTRPRQI